MIAFTLNSATGHIFETYLENQNQFFLDLRHKGIKKAQILVRLFYIPMVVLSKDIFHFCHSKLLLLTDPVTQQSMLITKIDRTEDKFNILSIH